MKVRHVLRGGVLAASVVLTILGLYQGAAVLVGLATVVELVAAAVRGKQTNI